MDKRERGWSARRKFEAIVASPTATAIRVLLSKTQYEWCLTLGTAPQLRADSQSFQEMLDKLDNNLFYDLGIILPAVTAGVDESLAETEFRLQLNDLRLAPKGGLSQDQFLVNATPEELHRIGVNGLKAINPATGNLCAIVQGREDVLEKCRQAFITHGPAGFIGLCLSGELSRNASHLLTTEVVECSLDLLRDTSPALVHSALERFDVLTLTWIMRDLLQEDVSIRNLRALLESLLSVRKLKPVDVAYYSNWARADFKRYISYKYSRGRNTLIVYLLAPQVEGRIAESDREPLTEDEHCRLLQSLLCVVEELSATAGTPVILTTVEARRKLWLLVEKELPSLVILAYQELSPDVNIQPLGRIELTDRSSNPPTINRAPHYRDAV
ncbi:MAG: FHIPEP family type III secretion protein, partial [Acidobacteria bacterium]|nr:FHIPEP family type III secretion protein [Acidobacteriota bacterium]